MHQTLSSQQNILTPWMSNGVSIVGIWGTLDPVVSPADTCMHPSDN